MTRNTLGYSSSALGRVFSCEKDMFYRFMSDDRIDWRRLLYLINLQLIGKITCRTDSRQSKSPVCLIADDSDLPKTGWCTELIGKVYSHVMHIQRLGYKGLFLTRTDGKTQTMLDYSLHGEQGKHADKPQGLTHKQLNRRFTKERDSQAPICQRIEEYTQSKLDRLIDMLKLAIKKGVRFDYLLVDSWFTCKELVTFIAKRHIKCYFLGMLKMGNTKYQTAAYGSLTAKGCIDKLKRVKKGIRYSRQLKCYYGEILVTFDGVPVKLFFCKRGKNGNWNGLLTTNTTLNFFEAYRIYSMRWAIEVGFAEMKGLLRLGKCQAQNFTAQIADISITLLQYNILGVVKRFEAYETIGQLFKHACGGTIELSITDKIWQLILEVVSAIAEAISADTQELMQAAIYGNQHCKLWFSQYYNEYTSA